MPYLLYRSDNRSPVNHSTIYDGCLHRSKTSRHLMFLTVNRHILTWKDRDVMGNLVPLDNDQRKERILIVDGCSWYLDEVQCIHVPGQSVRL